jgi:hypothetical protein
VGTLGEELGALALTAEFDHTLATYHAIAYELDAASAALGTALEKARRYRLVELATLAAGLRATIAAMRGHRRDAERQVAETLATVHDLKPLRCAVLSVTPLVAAALADDDPPTAVRRVSDARALLPPDRVVFQPPFFGSFYGLAAVVRAASGSSELAEGRDWVEFDDIFMSRPQAARSIAQRLILSEHTVHRHLASTLLNLDLSSRAAAAEWGARTRLV